jgi:hypothetical protein
LELCGAECRVMTRGDVQHLFHLVEADTNTTAVAANVAEPYNAAWKGGVRRALGKKLGCL